LSGLALVVGDIAFTEPLELNGRQHFGLMLGIELSKPRKRAQPMPGQILVAHLSIRRCVAKAVQRAARVAFRILL
jgi:hypothetical protein